MKPERWRQVKSVFDVAVELEGDARRAFLDGRDEDPELLDEVRELLAADGEKTRFLEPMDLDLSSLAALAPSAGDQDQDDEPLTGSEIEHFVVGRRLGVGGMGEVYSGFDTKLQREVALKAIRRGQRMDSEARGRFLREARILSNLDHPGICRIYDYVENETCDLLVLELIAGHSLRHLLTEPLSYVRKLGIAEQISAALAAAHAEGIVHRDLKPSNVMLTASDEVKVLDFGLARAWNATNDEEKARGAVAATPLPVLVPPAESEAAVESLPSAAGTQTLGSAARFQTAVGLITGTPSAMSPEQLHGEQATPASDMYSFGLLLQELFTGRPPYDPELTLSDLLQRAKRGDTRPASGIDKHLAALIESLKSTQVRDRATAAQARERLAWIRRKPQRRLRAALSAGAVAITLAAALKYTVDLSHERTAAVAAEAEADRRRGQAEELIGYMLGDLRGKLEPIGRLEILDDVGDRALDYFAAVPEAELSDDELHSRSLALAQIGEVRTAQGDLEAAQRAFDESLVLARGLAERRPENTDYLAGLGAAHFWVGTVHWWRSESEPALAEFHRYLEVAERLVASDAESSEWLMELSYAESNIGVVEKATGHRERALTRFHRALALNQQVVDREPGNATWLSDLADARSWVAETLAELGNLETALAEGLAYQQSVLELAAAHPGDAQLRRMAADTHDNVGSLLLQRGDLAGAEQEFAAYETAFSDLVGLDASNNDWRFALAIAGRRRGELLLEQGRPQQAAARLALAGTQFTELLAVDASNLEWSYQAGVCSALEAAALVAAGAPAEARRVVQRLLEQVAAGVFGELDDESVAALRAHAFLVAGDSRVASGRPAAGREAYDSALAAVSSLPQPAPHVTSRDLHAQILLRLGRSAEAQSILDALERSGYRRTFLRSTVTTN